MRLARIARIVAMSAAGTIAVVVLLTAIILRMPEKASERWNEFGIGPTAGRSSSIGTNAIRSDGVSLKVMVATAYDVPTVRVIGPPWLAQARYSIKAAVGTEQSESFRSLLQEELKKRLRLETHFEVRPFDVFTLTATGAPRLERSETRETSIWIQDWNVRLRDATLEGLAGALQNILGKPVIDETGITGWYNLEFGWQEDRVPSVTAILHDRFGLQLSPGKRDMEALIVDSIRRDASLVLLEQIGRVTSVAPARIRQRVSELLTTR